MKEFEFKILQTSDIHGNIYPHNYNNKEDSNCGFARVYNVIKKRRDKNTILIDTGDLIQGNALTYYYRLSNSKEINPMAKILNYAKYDYMVLGNHEFNYGQDYLNDFINNIDAKIITSNIYKEGKNLFNSYIIHTFDNDFKVAIIGIVTENIPLWENEHNIKGLTFLDAFDEAKRVISNIKENKLADCIVLGYHGGFEKNPETEEKIDNDVGENVGYKMINELDIDVFLTGHQHRVFCGIKNGIPYTQPCCNGMYVGEFRLKYAFENGVWVKKSVQNELIETKGYEVNKEVLQLNYELEEKTQEWLDKKLGILLDGEITIENHLKDRLYKNKLFTLINNVQKEFSGADISCTFLGNLYKGMKQEVTPREIMCNYKYSNTLVVLLMKGKDLLNALEKNSEFFTIENEEVIINEKYVSPKKEFYNYDVYEGIDYTIDLTKEIGHRVKNVTYKGKALEDDEEYKIVVNNYRAGGGGGFEVFKNAIVVEKIKIEITELIIEYFKKYKEVKIDEVNNIKFIIK